MRGSVCRPLAVGPGASTSRETCRRPAATASRAIRLHASSGEHKVTPTTDAGVLQQRTPGMEAQPPYPYLSGSGARLRSGSCRAAGLGPCLISRGRQVTTGVPLGHSRVLPTCRRRGGCTLQPLTAVLQPHPPAGFRALHAQKLLASSAGTHSYSKSSSSSLARLWISSFEMRRTCFARSCNHHRHGVGKQSA